MNISRYAAADLGFPRRCQPQNLGCQNFKTALGPFPLIFMARIPSLDPPMARLVRVDVISPSNSGCLFIDIDSVC